MVRHRRARISSRTPLAASLTDDDGQDPRELFRCPKTDRFKRKLAALCRQVRDAAEFALAECDDPWLAEWSVDEVLPHPNSSRFLLKLRPRAEDFACTRDEFESHFAAARRWLRAQVAAAIHRRRAPELVLTPSVRSSSGD